MPSFARLLLPLALLAAAPVAIVAPQRAAAQEVGLPVGTTAPAALLETLDGKPVNLGQYLGKTPVVLEFWATWCSNCEKLEPAMRAAAAKHGRRVKFVGVAVSVNQSPERVRRYAAAHRLPLEVLYDRKGDASEAYDVPATSYVVVIDRAGKVVYTGVGGDQDIEAAIRKAGP